MIRTCPKCGAKIKCIRCRQLGAFEGGGRALPPHTGPCVYEDCAPCSFKHVGDIITHREKEDWRKP